MTGLPETRYAKTTDGVHIAHPVVGEEAVDLVFVMGWTTNIETRTVNDLVTGSGLTFVGAGEHELKGAPDRWRPCRVVGG